MIVVISRTTSLLHRTVINIDEQAEEDLRDDEEGRLATNQDKSPSLSVLVLESFSKDDTSER